MPGPIPKRTDERRRVNKPDGVGVVAGPSVVAVQPDADPAWHSMALDWYESLASSGQAVFYQASDWATARVWAEILSRQLGSGRISAQMIAAWSAGATELLTTEGARRRARIELERTGAVDEDEDAAVLSISRYQSQVGA